MHADPHDDRRSTAPRTVPSIRLLLAVLAVLPLVGVSWFGIHDLSRTRRGYSEAVAVQATVWEYVEYASFRSAVLDERNWAMVTQGLAELGISNDAVVEFTGIDPDAEMVSARASVDRSVETVGTLDDETALEAVRARPTSFTESRALFIDIDRSIGELSEQLFRDLVSKTSNIGGSGDLIADLRVLEAATNARSAAASQLTTVFSVKFPSPGMPSEVRLLAGQQTLYERAMGALVRTARPGSDAWFAVENVSASADVRAFQSAIEDLITSTMNGSGSEGEFSSASILSDPESVASTFIAGLASATVHLDLVDGAAADVQTTTEQLADRASTEARLALVMLAALILATLLFAIAVGHQIVSPLRHLAQRAEQLRLTGKLETTVSRGAKEVRALGDAINEAAAHLALAERQAHALALGELDHPVLGESSPGELGSSLQEAVRTLTESLDGREEYRRRLAHQASHDDLTSLANRNASIELLRKAQARTRRSLSALAVMFVDLDGFKEVNDNCGHLAGDRVLRAVAQRLTESVRDGDHVGRLGGDEFVVIAEPVVDVADALLIANRIKSALSVPIPIDDKFVQVTCCIGLALVDDGSDLTADEFIHDADLAVYKAKALGPGSIEICDAALKAEANDAALLDQALRQAISSDELVLHYQPVVERDTGRTLGFEALVRWQRPGVGLVPPGDFIPFAERSELIVEIDRWVIDHVAAELGDFADDDGDDLPVSINVSARHFASARCVDDILEPLRRHHVDPFRLIVELTETTLLADVDEAAVKLETLRSTGVSIALDDFGTGYTSLAYLRQLPVDIIKIDRSFIDDSSARAFVKLIIDTGHLIGARIVAEGVETEQQVRSLSELGCDSFQGYYFGRPAPTRIRAVIEAEPVQRCPGAGATIEQWSAAEPFSTPESHLAR